MSVTNAPIAQEITVAGANLYELALQYLGDPTQWTRIARLNGIVPPDSIITGLVTLKIPPKGTGNGGVLTY